MAVYSDNLIDERNGLPIEGANLWVYDNLGVEATLTDALDQPLTQPLVTDADGGFEYKAADGTYRHDFWKNSVMIFRDNRVIVGTPATVTASLGAFGVTLLGNATASDARADLEVKSSAELASVGGADLIGTSQNGTVQDFVDAVKALDTTQYFYGVEYLSGFRKRMTDGDGNTIVMSGDSTTAGTAVAAGFVPDVLLKSIAHDYGADYQVFYNRGQSGKRTDDWVSTYLAGDMTASGGTGGTLYIPRWGVNDPDTALPGGPLTVSQTLANWETALSTYRATLPLNLSAILIMAPNSATGRGRTPAYFKAVSEGLRELARQYECAFFDTFNFFRDALANMDLGWDDALLDGTAAVHPLDSLNGAIYQAVGEILYGGLGPQKANHFWNRAQNAGHTLSAATLPASFEYGTTIDRALAASGFPADGFVVTTKSKNSATNAVQMFWDNNGPQFRIGGTSWLSWASVGGGSANVTAGSGFTNASGTPMKTVLSGAGVIGVGYVDMSTPATLTSGQTIATVAAGFRPPTQEWMFDLLVFQSSDSTFEKIPATMTTAGVITTMAVSTKTANRVYLQHVWSKI